MDYDQSERLIHSLLDITNVLDEINESLRIIAKEKRNEKK